MERGEEFAERAVFGELRKSVNVLRGALAQRLSAPLGVRVANGYPPKTLTRFLRRISITTLAVGTGDVGVGVVDVAREKDPTDPSDRDEESRIGRLAQSSHPVESSRYSTTKAILIYSHIHLTPMYYTKSNNITV